MAAYPVTRPPNQPPHFFIAGSAEPFVTSGHFSKMTVGAKTHLVPNAGHFFMLTHEDETVRTLREWMNKP